MIIDVTNIKLFNESMYIILKLYIEKINSKKEEGMNL